MNTNDIERDINANGNILDSDDFVKLKEHMHNSKKILLQHAIAVDNEETKKIKKNFDKVFKNKNRIYIGEFEKFTILFQNAFKENVLKKLNILPDTKPIEDGYIYDPILTPYFKLSKEYRERFDLKEPIVVCSDVNLEEEEYIIPPLECRTDTFKKDYSELNDLVASMTVHQDKYSKAEMEHLGQVVSEALLASQDKARFQSDLSNYNKLLEDFNKKHQKIEEVVEYIDSEEEVYETNNLSIKMEFSKE